MTHPPVPARIGSAALATAEVLTVAALVLTLAGFPVAPADADGGVLAAVSSTSAPALAPSSRTLDSRLTLSATGSALLAPGAVPAVVEPTADQPAADAPDPVGLSIASIGLDAPLTDIGRDAAGVLIPPTDLVHAGWYTESARPGSLGPAVIAGHVDDTRSAGVFARLRDLVPGDTIDIRRADGSVVTYAVTQLLDVSKPAFPTDVVYGATPDAQLRLITCNTPYDFEAHHYAHNLVVFATLVG